MAIKSNSCTTKRAKGTNGTISSPYVRFTIKQSENETKTESIYYRLDYIAPYAAKVSGSRAWSIRVGGTTIASGSFAINGVTGTNKICSGTYKRAKESSETNITFNVSFEFDLTWGNTSMSNSTYTNASCSYTMSALPNTVKVSYSASGAKNVPSPVDVIVNSKYSIPTSKPIKTGYRFVEWYSESNTYNPGESFKATSNITLTARFELVQYRITYDLKGGSGISTSQNKPYGASVQLLGPPTKSNARFIGWSKYSDGSEYTYKQGASYSKNANLKLYAIWEDIPTQTFTVSYNGSNGTGTLPASQTAAYNSTVTLRSTSMTKTDCRFIGWSTTSGSKTAQYKAGQEYKVTKDVTMYAVWVSTKSEDTGSNTPKPVINNFSYTRQELELGDGETSPWFSFFGNPRGEKIVFSFSWMSYVDNISSNNPIQLEIRMYRDGVQDKTVWFSLFGYMTQLDIEEDAGTITWMVDLVKPEQEYYMVFTIRDSAGTAEYSFPINSQVLPIDVLPNNMGLSFGKSAEHPSYADFRYQMLFTNARGIYGLTPLGDIVGPQFQPCNGSGNLTLGYGNYVYGKDMLPNSTGCRTNIYGREIYLATCDSKTSETWRPYYRKGDTVTINEGNYTGHITSSGTSFNFMIPLDKPIIGSPTVTVSWNGGIQLRQSGSWTVSGNTWSSDENGYCWGSTGSTFITSVIINGADYPLKITATYIKGIGLKCNVSINNLPSPLLSGQPGWIRSHVINNHPASAVLKAKIILT